MKSSKSLVAVAGLVAAATLLSKFGGLVRQLFIAAAFGVSGAVDAYNYAYALPGFVFILLGGLNGPFHSSVVSVLTRRLKTGSREDAARLLNTIATLVSIGLLAVSIVLYVLAPGVIGLVAAEATPEVRALAVEMFRVMTPLIFLSGLIGIGFGVLNAVDHYLLPSLSPLCSSVSVAIAVWFFADAYGPVVIAWGFLAGAVLQWLLQVPLQLRARLGGLRPQIDLAQPGVSEVTSLMAPAVTSSSVGNINTYTDLFFASQLAIGTASALNYSTLLVQAPLGTLSSAVLVPLMPVFARFAEPSQFGQLRHSLRQGLVATAIVVLPISAVLVSLAEPIVQVVFERGEFDRAGTKLVASVFGAMSLGMVFYLCRDLLIRVFYALGDGKTPLKVAVAGVAMNFALDLTLIRPFGAAGIALATVGNNALAFGLLTWLLHSRLGGLEWRSLVGPMSGLVGGAVLTGGLAGWSYGLADTAMPAWAALLVALGTALLVQAVWLRWLGLPEVELVAAKVLGRFRRSKSA